jgi:hypothetical protein
MSLGGTQSGKLVTVQSELPADVDGIIDEIRRIILLGEVQTITVKNGEPITYQRLVREGEEVAPSESTQSFAELSLAEIVRNINMEEFDPMDDPCATLVWMIHTLELDGWSATHLAVSKNTDFWKWVGVDKRIARSLNQFLGLRIERVDLPATIFLLCGASHRNATVAELGFVLKGTTEGVIDERTDKEGN